MAKARAGLMLITVAGLVLAGTSPSVASSHREAPLVAGEPQVDATDLYAFVSPDAQDTVTLISNWIPFQEPSGGPNFYPWAENTRYEINIDNNGDAKPDIIYRWTFESNYKSEETFLYNTGPVNDINDATLNFTQTYTLERIEGSDTEELLEDAPVAPSHVGEASMPNYPRLRQQAITSFDGGGKSFAGQADDSFFLDLRVFDLLYGADLSEVGNDTLDGYNVNTIAVQVPKDEVARDGNSGDNPIIGVWTTASRPSMRVQGNDGTVELSGDMVQVSRLGNPLVNEVVVPVGKKDLFNASRPENDAQFLPRVEVPEVPQLIEKIYNMPAPPTPRADLVSVFLTGVEGLNKPEGGAPSEQLRLNMSIAPSGSANRLGVIGGDKAGFPNGRRLADDVVDIELQVLEGELIGSPNDLGDGVNANDVAFADSFPYVALPHSGSDTGGGTNPAQVQAGGQSAPSGAGAGTQSQGTAAAQSQGAPVGGVGAGGGGTAGGSLPLVPLTAAGAGVLLSLAGAAAGWRRRRAA